ncbi:MAG: ABC-type transport auxiliary lipoprotein family protein [Alphaproteobacteria bacterium]
MTERAGTERAGTERAGFTRRWIVLAGAFVVTGCAAAGLIPDATERPDLYILTPKSTFDPALPNVHTQLAVDLPFASAGIDTGRIALMHTPMQLDYYARSNWIDRAPAMVQKLIIESFENSNRIVGVGRVSVNLRADYVLVTELREFQVEYFGDGAPVIHVQLNAKLVRFPERIIVGNVTSEEEVTAAEDAMGAIIAAFDDALGKSLRDIVGWTLRAMASSQG